MTRAWTFEQLAKRLEELLGHRIVGVTAAVILAAAVVVGCGGGDSESTTYSAQLRPVDGSGVDGEARLELAGDHLELDIRATGLVPNRVHEQRLQAGSGGRCGGDTLLALTPYPTVGDDGRLDYDNTLELDGDEVGLSNATVALFGSSADGRYRPEAPVACGRLER